MSYLLEGGKEGIINPMVFNMAPAYENAKYPNIWISTSRIKGKAILPPLPGNNKNQIILEIMHKIWQHWEMYLVDSLFLFIFFAFSHSLIRYHSRPCM